jgi:hypothetical protein
MMMTAVERKKKNEKSFHPSPLEATSERSSLSVTR